MSGAPRRIFTIVLILVLAGALAPARAADVKLTLWRLKTYIPPADKILDTTIQDCSKKIGAEVQIQTYTFDDMWTKYTAAIESKTLPDVAELDAVGPARLANLGRLSDVSDLVSTVVKDLVEKVGAQPPDTLEAINDISIKIKKAGLQDFPQGFPWNRTGDGYDPAMSLLWSYGAAWVDKSGKY